ncbi:MAG: sulfite exporter TauE/SafE family protein [Sphingobacteriia bacterium]|nr:MAG: sulfite exporter TauE/SafE family protein [Sphingobacteriia bacterium]
MTVFFISALVLGFTGSVHCLGMCGPLVLAMPFQQFAGPQKMVAMLLYHLSRAMAYALLGLVVGSLGWGFQWFGWLQTLSLVLGLLLLFSLLWPRVQKYFSLSTGFGSTLSNGWTRFVMKRLQKALQSKSLLGMAWVGFLNGFLPCGLVYMAIAGAMASASAWKAAGFMVFFGWGTLPAMLALVFLGQQMPLHWRPLFRKAIPWTTGLVAILLILRGLNLDIPFISPYINSYYPAASAIDCHK